MPSHCTCHHPRREPVYMLAFAVLLALFMLMLDVAVLGVHICGDEVAMVAQAVRSDVAGQLSSVVSGFGNTFRGERS